MKLTSNTYQIWNYKPRQLSAYIDSFAVYHFKNEKPVLLNPEGQFELIFQLDGNFLQNNINNSDWNFRPDFFIGGLHNTSYNIKPEKKGSKLISVQFKPHCARFFIPDKLNFFKNRVVNMKDVFRKSKMHQIEEIRYNNDIEKSLQLIESFLMNVFTNRSDSRMDAVLNRILQQKGFINIEELAQFACLSNSQLRKRFNEEVGMSPKEYSKIIRTRFISSILRNNPQTKLTELTYELGYFDQSHFIRDFKSVTGYSPKHFQKIN